LPRCALPHAPAAGAADDHTLNGKVTPWLGVRAADAGVILFVVAAPECGG